jgi:hypothetical protein
LVEAGSEVEFIVRGDGQWRWKPQVALETASSAETGEKRPKRRFDALRGTLDWE